MVFQEFGIHILRLGELTPLTNCHQFLTRLNFIAILPCCNNYCYDNNIKMKEQQTHQMLWLLQYSLRS